MVVVVVKVKKVLSADSHHSSYLNTRIGTDGPALASRSADSRRCYGRTRSYRVDTDS